MSEVTVKHFAETIGVAVDRLLSQLEAAGVSARDADALIGDQDKAKLLSSLREKHGADEGTEEPVAETGPKKITLSRRTTSELKVPSTGGKAKTVTVQVRKKRTYVKRSLVEEGESESESDSESKPIDEEVVSRLEKQVEEDAARAAEVQRQQAEEDARRRAEQEVLLKAEEEARLKAEVEARMAAEAVANQPERRNCPVGRAQREQVIATR